MESQLLSSGEGRQTKTYKIIQQIERTNWYSDDFGGLLRSISEADTFQAKE
jgi:hypothetical protein